MKERPILFNGEMVRAILEGRKTQTRRVVKHQPDPDYGGGRYKLASSGHLFEDRASGRRRTDIACPYGRPGDRLWVRETHSVCHLDDDHPVIYRADPMFDGMEPGDFAWRWTPSIHMPRWASRITLEITDVRVERVQDISEHDAREEGLTVPQFIDNMGQDLTPYSYPLQSVFAGLWDSINEKRGFGWDANPWVWVVEFKKVRP